jgi:uncharacterized protein YjaG (DUF416 family)
LVFRRFNERELAESIEGLPEPARAAFAAACAERLLPAYHKFSARSNRGDPRILEQILTRLWTDLSGEPMSEAETEAQIDACMGLIPQEDDGPWVAEQAAAEDAVAAIAYALRCRRSGLAKEAAWAARRAYEALDDYVINHENVDTNIAGAEAQVLAHPLVQAELARQQQDLDDLLGGTINIDRLRERSKAEAAEFLP